MSFPPKRPGRPKIWTPPPGHENMMDALRRALAVPKAEVDRREKQWQERPNYRGKSTRMSK